MEDTSKLRAHSTSLINIAIIKGKQLQTRTFQCFKEAGLAALTKPRAALAPVIYRAKNRATNFKTFTDTVHRYAVAVRNIWIKNFTEKHVLSLTNVKNQIEKIMKNYENCVRTVNSGNNNDPTSLRARNKLWMSMDVPKPKTKKGDFKNCKNSSLFDISRNMETTKDKGGNVVEGLTGNEKLFYADQRGEHRHLLSQGIDTEYEAKQWKIQQAEVESQTSHYCWWKHCFRNISCKGSNCNS